MKSSTLGPLSSLSLLTSLGLAALPGCSAKVDGFVSMGEDTGGASGIGGTNSQISTGGTSALGLSSTGGTSALSQSGAGGANPQSRCGDGILQSGEQCDNGSANANNQCGGCSTSCTLNPYCGDGIVQSQCGEQCDDGTANASLDNVPYDSCLATCTLGPHCGDGIVQNPPEQCDLGAAANGPNSPCSSACVLQTSLPCTPATCEDICPVQANGTRACQSTEDDVNGYMLQCLKLTGCANPSLETCWCFPA